MPIPRLWQMRVLINQTINKSLRGFNVVIQKLPESPITEMTACRPRTT